MLELMLSNMSDGVIMTDASGNVCLLNASARRMLGLGIDVEITTAYLKERMGFYPFDLVTGSGPDVVREELKLGDRQLHSMVQPVKTSEGQLVGILVVLRDLTEWRELDRRKEEFISVVSHELRTPLTSITGALDIVLHDVSGLSAKQQRYLGIARHSCTRMSEIVDDLLEVASFQNDAPAMDLVPLFLDELASEAAGHFEVAAAQKNVAMVFGARSSGIRILGDRSRLHQVLHNLLSNAVKFTPSDGTGRIEVEVFGPGVASTHVGVSVWNNGTTIAVEDSDRVFATFEQVASSSTRQVGGTGLGLPISRGIIEAHGGRIWVERAHEGAKFVFTLPAAPELRVVTSSLEERAHRRTPSESELTHPAVEAPSVPTGRRVLVVSADTHSGYLLKGILMTSEQNVTLARNCDEALALARHQHPDLVVVDASIEEAASLVQILRHDPDTNKASVLVVHDHDDDHENFEARADAALTRPLDLDLFQTTCGRLLADHGDGGGRVRIMLVEDDDTIRMITRDILESAGYLVREAATGAIALDEARTFRPDLFLLDVMMPDMDGFETARRLRAQQETQMTPIIFVSARGQTADKVRAFKMGADDYMVKPVDNAELLARVGKALERKQRELGASPTTMLPGVNVIETEVERRIGAAHDVAFCYLDLDNLKAFNDYYGYAKADGVIRQTADLLRETVRAHGSGDDFIGHIAGDDFVFITEAQVADRVCLALCQRFDELIPLYYNPADRERGHIDTVDRFGEMRRFPFMTVSIAALTLRGHDFSSFADVGNAAAEAKKQAKAIPGSSYVRDGRVVTGSS